MDNIKQLLIEKEREAYLANQTPLAQFYADTLDYVIELEEKISSFDVNGEELLGAMEERADDIRNHARDVKICVERMREALDGC